MDAEFKIGDKVKVLEKGNEYTGRVGVICNVGCPGRTFRYGVYFDGNRARWRPFRPSELIAAPTKGEQLLLFEL